jgi:hypothetical protein
MNPQDMKVIRTEVSKNVPRTRGGCFEDSRTTNRRLVHLAQVTSLALVWLLIASLTEVWANHEQRQLDLWSATRQIPDLASGGIVTLSADQIIDVIVLGDGYLASERDAFFQQAQDWYDEYLSPNGERPFTFFSQAFRVRAIFNASSQRASSARDSYYRINIQANSCNLAGGNWWNDDGTNNETFRSRLFGSIDALSPPVNLAEYPDNLTVKPPTRPSRAGVYSNLFVVMFVRADNDAGEDCTPRGTNHTITTGTRKVQVVFEAPKHEFGHVFADLEDEYILTRGTVATYSNPAPQSVWSLFNLTYTNERCNLLWPHLAPGGRYNPNVFSPIGNLFIGGDAEKGVWHSEYKCQMNGLHENYKCDIDPSSDPIDLRDRSRFCIWCQEVLTVRILEKTGQFRRPGDPDNIIVRGQVWFNLWETTLRDRYYVRFDIPRLIAEKNVCYGFGDCPNPSGNCSSSCNTNDMPACLLDCGIREVGNAIYVDSTGGAPGNPGTRAEPLDTVLNGVVRANAVCTSPYLVAIQPGSYPGSLTISQPAILIPAGCSPVVLGR